MFPLVSIAQRPVSEQAFGLYSFSKDLDKAVSSAGASESLFNPYQAWMALRRTKARKPCLKPLSSMSDLLVITCRLLLPASLLFLSPSPFYSISLPIYIAQTILKLNNLSK